MLSGLKPAKTDRGSILKQAQVEAHLFSIGHFTDHAVRPMQGADLPPLSLPVITREAHVRLPLLRLGLWDRVVRRGFLMQAGGADCLRKCIRARLSKHATGDLVSDHARRNRQRTMAALWREATRSLPFLSLARHARCPQRCAGARGNASTGVVRSVGRTFARLGGHSPGAQAIHPPSKLDLRRELVRDYR